MERAAQRWGPDGVLSYPDIVRSASVEQAMSIDQALEQFNCGEPVLFFPYTVGTWSMLTENGLVWCRDGQLGYARHDEIQAAEGAQEAGRSLAGSPAGPDDVVLQTRGGTVRLKARPGSGVQGLVSSLEHARARRYQQRW